MKIKIYFSFDYLNNYNAFIKQRFQPAKGG
jgi:hypothetical protein